MTSAGSTGRGRRHRTPFARYFTWLLTTGVRPDGQPDRLGRPWENGEFAHAAGASVDTVRRWRSGARRPHILKGIERAIFGDNPAYDSDRRKLRELHAAARSRSDLSALVRPDEELATGIALPWRPGEWTRFRDDILDKLGAKTLFEQSDITVFSRSDLSWSLIFSKSADSFNKQRF